MKTKSIVAVVLTMTSLVACQKQRAPEDGIAPESSPALATPAEKSAAQPAVAAVSELSAFDGATLEGAARANCSIDKIGSAAIASGPVTLAAGQTVVFSGWIAGPGNRVPEGFKIVLKGKDLHSANAAAGASRPDVARVLKSESLANAGFNTRINLGALPEGEYGVELVIPGETIANCDTPAKIVIVPATNTTVATN